MFPVRQMLSDDTKELGKKLLKGVRD